MKNKLKIVIEKTPEGLLFNVEGTTLEQADALIIGLARVLLVARKLGVTNESLSLGVFAKLLKTLNDMENKA